MQQERNRVDPAKRHRTKYSGVFYRERRDGTKTYLVSTGGGRFTPAATLKDALALQGDLRSRKARGERVVINDRTKFSELAAEWMELRKTSGKRPLRARTAGEYQA